MGGFKENYKDRICEDCGEHYWHSYNIRYCPECRSRRHSESRKKAYQKELSERGTYSFQSWESSVVDEDVIRKGRECCLFLLENFTGFSDSLSSLSKKLDSRLNILSNVTLEDRDYLMRKNVWKEKCVDFIYETLYEQYLDDLEHEGDSRYLLVYNRLYPIFEMFVPSPALCAQLTAHCENHQRSFDPLKLRPLVIANLKLEIIKEFELLFKEDIYEAYK